MKTRLVSEQLQAVCGQFLNIISEKTYCRQIPLFIVFVRNELMRYIALYLILRQHPKASAASRLLLHVKQNFR